jgi:hypothetical protein
MNKLFRFFQKTDEVQHETNTKTDNPSSIRNEDESKFNPSSTRNEDENRRIQLEQT